VSDDHSGLEAARKAIFTGIPWQRCQFHLQQNAQSYVPRVGMRSEVAEDIRSIFDSPNYEMAEELFEELLKKTVAKYARLAPKLADWMEVNIPEIFTMFEFPKAHQKRIRTSNQLERLSQEIKRRTRVIRVFPNEASCLRLISAILLEYSDEWEFGRLYLDMSQV
jgi:transposase-like protein